MEAFGLGDLGGAGRGEEVVELVETAGVEDARSLGDALDLDREPCSQPPDDMSS